MNPALARLFAGKYHFLHLFFIIPLSFTVTADVSPNILAKLVAALSRVKLLPK